MSTKVYKRRLIPIIDPAFQYKYTAAILLVAATISALLGLLLWRSYNETNSMLEVVNSIADINPEIARIIEESDRSFVFQLTVGFLVAEVLILGIIGLLITHRVCGPVFVVKRHLQTLSEGGFPTLRALRQGDEFVDMFTSLQKVTDSLKSRDQREADKLKGLLHRATSLSVDDQSVLQAMLKEREDRLATAAPART
jgi:methyl-accepting chemotaxis protein